MAVFPALFFFNALSSPPSVGAAPLMVREALSGISSTISLVSWIVLLVPQIIENYKNQNGDGISIAFLVIWLFGDLANLVGSIEAHLLSTVITLAVYFCLADFIIIGQTLYYKYINKRKTAVKIARRQSRVSNLDDPTEPLLPHHRSSGANSRNRHSSLGPTLSTGAEKQSDTIRTVSKGIFSILAVVLVGCLGWLLAWKSGAWSVTVGDGEKLEMPWVGAVLGYTSAALYLSARIPQITKNHQGKSCEGLSMLFFILSLMGNITYGAGILFHSTEQDYVIDNLPWLIGSLGTMIQDFIIFGQFHYYSGKAGKIVEDGSAIV